MIRWFADLPIERKLRIVIGAPAIAAFTLAVIMHLVTNLLHSRAELRLFATRVADVTGVNVIEALEAGDDKGAVKALQALREEPGAGSVQIALPDGRILATYTRGLDGAAEIELDPLSKTLASVKLPPPVAFDPGQRPASALQAGRVRITAAAVAEGKVLGTVLIIAPLDAVYPDWLAFLLMTAAAIGRRAVRRLLGRGAAAAANIRAHRESRANDEAGVDWKRITPCGSRAAPRTRSAR